MKPLVQTLIFWMPLILGACTGSPGYHMSEYKEVKLSEMPEDIKIPSKAWDLLEMKAAHSEAGGKGGHGGGEAAPSSTNIIFSEVSAFLVQKNPGIVKGEAVKISLPKGGGSIDLAEFISAQKGTFYVGFDFPAFEGAKVSKVLFVSGVRKRKIGGQIFGAGCNQFFDITERFFKEMKGEGLKVNTTQERYLGVLGGTFLFAAQKDKNIYIAQVTFRHSEHKPLFCGEQ